MASLNPHPLLSDTSASSSSTSTASTTATGFSLASSPEARQVQSQKFTSLRRLYSEIKLCNEDCLTYGSISEDIYQKIEAWRDRSGRRSRLFYLAELQLLIITIPTAVHESLHAFLYTKFDRQLGELGLVAQWIPKQSSSFSFGGSSAESDSSGGPRDTRGRGSNWPTLVIESGYSQSWPSLRLKMRWWFGASAGQVKIVILAKIEISARRIVLEKWVLGLASQRIGATITRHFAATQYEPLLSQTFMIIRPTGHTYEAAELMVEGAPLILEFRLLFLRDPVAGERDVELNEATLRDFALCVWNALE